MKLRKIKWKDHPILNNLELNLVNPITNQPYETILLAGENGTGKTTILETISTFLNGGTFEYFDYIEYEADGNILKALEGSNPSTKFFYTMSNGTQTFPMNTGGGHRNAAVDENPLNIRFSGCVFSKARADYKTDTISSITTKQLDTEKFNTD